MREDRIEIVCPAGHGFRVRRRHLGKSVRCAHPDCQERFTLRPPEAPPPPALARWSPPAAAPLRGDTVEFEDLQRLFRPPVLASPEPDPSADTLPAPAPAAGATAPRPRRRRPWFALASLVALGLFAFYAPVQRCPDCDGAGERGGQALYRGGPSSFEPAGVTPVLRCGRCAGAGRLSPYQLIYDWIQEQ